MKLFFRIIFKIFLILTILAGYATAGVIKETYSDALLNQGIALLEKGHYDLSINYFNKAIEINPRFSEAYNNRAFVYFYKGDYEKAWGDVYKVQSLGYKVHPVFFNALRQASGREK
jgi:tetratricopeptide (TPR) repeat protein